MMTLLVKEDVEEEDEGYDDFCTITVVFQK